MTSPPRSDAVRVHIVLIRGGRANHTKHSFRGLNYVRRARRPIKRVRERRRMRVCMTHVVSTPAADVDTAVHQHTCTRSVFSTLSFEETAVLAQERGRKRAIVRGQLRH